MQDISIETPVLVNSSVKVTLYEKPTNLLSYGIKTSRSLKILF